MFSLVLSASTYLLACKSKALETQTVMAMKAMRRKAMKAAKKDDDDAAAPMKRRRAMKAKK